jgi:hypothetical protein
MNFDPKIRLERPTGLSFQKATPPCSMDHGEADISARYAESAEKG